ncbi:hypothetical protein DFH07DRAFT_782394 [Mycena maculata]|uniref:Uncharacterized protein n=1 Tax=Mycena maculata TaxID=230809 RepID=A0AAD7HT19_9AGAR|nr:hypothetical protein DFH07DRAFT_782394 [Mycena maculata]
MPAFDDSISYFPIRSQIKVEINLIDQGRVGENGSKDFDHDFDDWSHGIGGIIWVEEARLRLRTPGTRGVLRGRRACTVETVSCKEQENEALKMSGRGISACVGLRTYGWRDLKLERNENVVEEWPWEEEREHGREGLFGSKADVHGTKQHGFWPTLFPCYFHSAHALRSKTSQCNTDTFVEDFESIAVKVLGRRKNPQELSRNCLASRK